MSRPKSKSQLNLPPMLRANGTQSEPVRPKCTQDPDPDRLASEIFDEALAEAKVTTAEVAFLFGVSESVVRRMRSKDARERVSFGQMLRLPLRFHVELHRAMNRRFGLGRFALQRLLDAAGDLAVAVE